MKPSKSLLKMPKRKIILLYMPVYHRGYKAFLDAHKDADEVYVFGKDILKGFDYLRKDLRALSPDNQVTLIGNSHKFKSVSVCSQDQLKQLDTSGTVIILPDEDISRSVAESLELANCTLYPVFLRWDRRSVENAGNTNDEETIASGEFERSVMQKALQVADKSSDIWRHVGAVLITKDGVQNQARNKGEPTEHSPWIEGDPRNIFNRGVGIEMSVFMHAEAALIAEAARRGESLDGATLFVTTYPCPACAKLIAHSGIKTCYYKDGYAVLDGARIMRDYGVDTVRVVMGNQEDDSSKEAALIPYKN